MAAKKLLIVDDQPSIGEFICRAAERKGFQVMVTIAAPDFLEALDSFAPDIVILDVVMPEKDGIELIRHMAEKGNRARLIIVSGYNSLYLKSSRILAEDLGLNSVIALSKPIELDELEAALGDPD